MFRNYINRLKGAFFKNLSDNTGITSTVLGSISEPKYSHSD